MVDVLEVELWWNHDQLLLIIVMKPHPVPLEVQNKKVGSQIEKS
jgi:hypothetical protein